jgi:hypothetical protein
MRVIERVLLVVGCLLGGNLAAIAQPQPDTLLASRSMAAIVRAPDGISPSERLSSLEQWARDYAGWQVWFQQWRNTREPGWIGSRSRHQRPEPPPWLADVCPVPADEGTPLADGCRLLDQWRTEDVATTVAVAQTTTTRNQAEAPTRSVWWQHIHLDALWPMTDGNSGVFGLLGVHATIPVGGRVQMFVAPGAMLMRIPGIDGTQQWQPATDWGFSYRMATFVIPGMQRPAILHLNLAKVWMLGQTPLPASFDSGMYLAGFSLTFRKATS